MNKLRRFAGLVLIPSAITYLVVAGLLIADYGQTWDDQENFGIGHKFVGFYATGELRFASDEPVLLPGHPPVYNTPFVREEPFRQWPFANEISALCCNLLFSGRGWPDAVAAHHFAAPLFVAFLLVGMGCFVARHFNRFTALLAVALLLSYPRFWGHALSNIKDIPQLVLFSLSLLGFGHWFLDGCSKRIWFWLSFVVFGLALATKADALLIPGLVLLWQLPRWRRVFERAALRVHLRRWGQLGMGLLVSALVFAACCPPMWLPGRWLYLEYMVQYLRQIAVDDSVGWNLYAPSTILYVTPVATLAVFVLGCVWSLRRVHKTLDPRSLLVIWALVPVLRHCLPGSNHYDGLRHFIVFLVPACILAADVIRAATAWMWARFRIPLAASRSCLCLLLLVPHGWGILETHPYQTTYYNAWVGGLGGAQARKLPEACDYWCTSYRDAGRWLDRNAQLRSAVASWPNETLIFSCLRRDDLGRWDPRLEQPPPRSYLVLVPRFSSAYETQLRSTLTLVHRVERQGGEIYSIYFQP